MKTVLVADDTAFVRERFRSVLEGAGRKAVTLRTLIVLDLRLPQGNGVALLRAIRKIAPRPSADRRVQRDHRLCG